MVFCFELELAIVGSSICSDETTSSVVWESESDKRVSVELAKKEDASGQFNTLRRARARRDTIERDMNET